MCVRTTCGLQLTLTEILRKEPIPHTKCECFLKWVILHARQGEFNQLVNHRTAIVLRVFLLSSYFLYKHSFGRQKRDIGRTSSLWLSGCRLASWQAGKRIIYLRNAKRARERERSWRKKAAG